MVTFIYILLCLFGGWFFNLGGLVVAIIIDLLIGGFN